ncbi:MAG: ribosomal L7Ae/L30e/S12e/Gadd45 family protein [Lachnospiraceae bacterium]|nr:ribosomal L7Ae/L30e/S12e/Gadd45 family protein [Lachnospiraceae bacterium]
MGREGLEKRIYSLLGIAKKAGFAQGGEFLAEKAVKSFKAGVVLVATDASDNTKKKFRDMCAFYEVPCYEFGDKDNLGRALGNEMRASVAVKDAGISKKLMELLDSLDKA